MSQFDPQTQALNYTSAYGETSITFLDLQAFLDSNIQVSIVYGCRIGCAGLMSLALWLISKNRRTPIFILNQFSLMFLAIHSALYLAYIFGPYNSVATYFTGFDLSNREAKQVSVATDVIYVFLIASIESSLVFQVKMIFKSPEVFKAGLVLTVISALMALATVGAYLMALVESVLQLYKDEPAGEIAVNLPIVLFAASTIFISLILCIKLGLAIRSRRYLGLKQFGTLHILIIMTSQTMVIPTILVILSFSYITTIYTRLTPIAIMIVTLQLPLSSMWASSANNSSVPTSSGDSYFSKISTRETIITSTTMDADSSLKREFIHTHLTDEDEDEDSNSEYAIYPQETKTVQLKRVHQTPLSSYQLDDEDKMLWEQVNRMSDFPAEGE